MKRAREGKAESGRFALCLFIPLTKASSQLMRYFTWITQQDATREVSPEGLLARLCHVRRERMRRWLRSTRRPTVRFNEQTRRNCGRKYVEQAPDLSVTSDVVKLLHTSHALELCFDTTAWFLLMIDGFSEQRMMKKTSVRTAGRSKAGGVSIAYAH